MTNNTAAPEVVEAAPIVKSRLSLVVMLSIVLGVLLTLGGTGAFFHLQASKVLQAKVLAAKIELKKNNLAIDEIKVLVESLSAQIHELKEQEIARSSRASEKDAEAESEMPAVDAATSVLKSVDGKEKPRTAEVLIPPRTKKPKSNKPNCDLVGKSPEEQAETLKRCVTLMDFSR